MSDRIVLMKEGRIVQDGDPAEIYERPRTVFASHFIGEANLLEGAVTQEGRVRVGNVEIAAPTTGVDDGREVVVSIRPERIAIGGPGALPAGDNRFAGRVERRVFLGNLVRYLVEIAPGLIVTVEAGVEQASFAQHEEIEVAWFRDSSIVLTER